MKGSDLAQTLEVAVKTRRPVMIWGSPGIGKSAIVRAVADKLYCEKSGGTIDANGDYHDASGHLAERPYFIDLRASQLDPVDLRGIPRVVDGLTQWATPVFWPQSGEGIIFFDEINGASPSTMAALYQPILDRRCGEYLLPEGWAVVAAGNRRTDKGITNEMGMPLRSRFLQVTLDSDLTDWIANYALPNNVRPEVIAFLRLRPECFNTFDPKASEMAFGCARSWDFASQFIQAGLPKTIENEVLSGLVGQGNTAEYLGFIRVYRTMPHPQKILKNPDTETVPDNAATLYAVCGALARLATETTFAAIHAYGKRLPKEFGVLLVRDCVALHPEVMNTEAYGEWAIDNKNVFVTNIKG